ncbi:hypothetical protein UlMin_010385, partial [Ulmus minor]
MARTRRSNVPWSISSWFLKLKLSLMLKLSTALSSLMGLIYVADDPSGFFLASEAIRATGNFLLIHSLASKKTCSGLSLKSQELTALYLAARVYCGFVMESGIHTVVDIVSFLSTASIIYMMRFKLKSSYCRAEDQLPLYYLVVPCLILASLIHPNEVGLISDIVWAFSLYLESLSILPQLLVTKKLKSQRTKPFTSNYVHALAVARFLSCTYWFFEGLMTFGDFLSFFGSGLAWISMALIADCVQTCILVIFCYYYYVM